jgi:hypothetical protein
MSSQAEVNEAANPSQMTLKNLPALSADRFGTVFL